MGKYTSFEALFLMKPRIIYHAREWFNYGEQYLLETLFLRSRHVMYQTSEKSKYGEQSSLETLYLMQPLFSC